MNLPATIQGSPPIPTTAGYAGPEVTRGTGDDLATAYLLLSGGMDSTTLLHYLHRDGFYVHSLIFDYGQRHIREIGFARRHCEALKLPFDVIELHRIKGLFLHSALTDGDGDVVVKNRNAVLLEIAAAIAAGNGVRDVYIGCNADDAKNFPDCREGFIDALNNTLRWAQVGVTVHTPFIGLPKSRIAKIAKSVGLDPHDTYSCYLGGETECGECLACQQRKEALA